MGWTDPITWEPGDELTAALFNEQIRNNLNYLKQAQQIVTVDNDANYSTTSQAFVDIDATNLSLSITTSGGVILVIFRAALYLSSEDEYVAGQLDIAINGTRQGGAHGLYRMQYQDSRSTDGNTITIYPQSHTMIYLTADVAAGTHTVKMQWRKSGPRGGTLLMPGSGSGGIVPTLQVVEFVTLESE